MNQRESDGAREFISLMEVERDETDAEAGGWVTFDSFTAEGLDNYELLKALHSLEWPGGPGLLTLRAPYNSVRARLQNIDDLNGAWLRIKVNGQANQDRIPAQVVMFGDNAEPPQVGIESSEPLPRNIDEMLSSIWMLRAEVESPASVISGLLDIPLRGLDMDQIFVAAYDVGQGNCNAIVDCYEHPRIFFDLGWAPNFHAKSRPPRVPELFACDSRIGAPVVLSHWDMDHWCYAIQSSAFDPGSLTTTHTWKPEALKRLWIARAPLKAHKIGPLTKSFYHALANTQLLPGFSAIQLWPKGTKKISFSAGWLEACTPATGGLSDRNNTGIAMFVRPSTKRGAILLPGDADFPSIPSLVGKRKTPLAGMVAPHHGARITPGSAPGPRKSSPSRLVMSVGDGNSYGHPKQQAVNEYATLGWTSSRTQDRYDCLRIGGAVHHHGNTLLKFQKSIGDPKCGCKSVDNGNLCLVPSSHSVVSPIPGVKRSKSTKKKTKKPAAATV